MSATRFLIVNIISFVIPFLLTGKLKGQEPGNDTLVFIRQIIDTSDYLPSTYVGASDYNLMIAASKGYTDEIERLISEGADINAETQEGATPLIFAVMNNRIAAVKTLLKYNPDVNIVTLDYETPLLIAVKNSSFTITEDLIRAGADVDFGHRDGVTALHYASLYGSPYIVDLLLYYNSDVDIKSDDGTTPMLASVRGGYSDILAMLIGNGANMESRDNDGYTPFLMAALYGDTIMLDILYKKGVDIYAVNNFRYNALNLSILTGDISTTEYLLKIGKNWTDPSKGALSPYSVAIKYSRKEIVKILNKNSVPGHLKYEVDQVAVSASSRFSFHDIYTGLSLSFKEPYLNAGITAGADVKFWYTRVLIKDSEVLFHQYMDKGSVVYAGFFKDFSLTDFTDRSNYSISTSIFAGYSFGNKLKGTMIEPDNQFSVIPSVSLKVTRLYFSFNAGVEYLKTDYYHQGPLWFRVGCSYTLYFDNVRTKIKPLKW